MTELYYDDLQRIAQNAGVNESILNAMYLGVAIHRVDAVKLLAAFSEYTKNTWTLDNVKVALLPTFKDICTSYDLDMMKIAMFADIPYAIVDMLFIDEPVPEKEACLVLGILSLETGRRYTLENVDVALASEVVQP